MIVGGSINLLCSSWCVSPGSRNCYIHCRNCSPPHHWKDDELQIAYLVLAHYQPDHLAKLVEALDVPGSLFFVHKTQGE
jgi:hypothetical protein